MHMLTTLVLQLLFRTTQMNQIFNLYVSIQLLALSVVNKIQTYLRLYILFQSFVSLLHKLCIS